MSSIFLLISGKLLLGLWINRSLFDRLPTWDPAAHLMDGVIFSEAIRRLDPLLFLEKLSLSSYWPPLYPLIEAPFFLVFGNSMATATVIMWIISLLSLALIFCHQFAFKDKFSKFSVVFASLLFALSPALIAYSSVIMLEIPGILFTLVASLCYTKYLSENRMNESWWRRTCLASTLLFFCKYNYLIIWIISLVTFELITNEKFRQDTTHFSKRILSSFDKRSPFCWISLCYFLLLSFVALFGGIDTVFLEHRLVFKSILGNPIYGFMLFAAIYHLIFHRERFKLAWLAFINAPEPYRSANRLFIVPVLIWFAYPPNFSTFLSFLVNQSKRDSFFSLKTLVFYPTYFISEVSFNGIVGTIVLGGFFAGFLWLRKFSLPERFIFWLAMLGYSFCVIHPNYIDRYLLTTVPFIFISASLSILRMSRSIFSESSIGPISLLVCLLSVIFVEHNASYQNQFVLRETRSKEIFHLIDPICKKAMESSPTNVVGFNSEMSPDLVAWRCLTLYPDIPMIALPKTINRISGLSYQTSPEDILASKKVANFAVISYDQPQQNDPSFIYRKSEYLELKDMLSKSSHVKLGEYYFVTSLEQHVQFYHRVQ